MKIKMNIFILIFTLIITANFVYSQELTLEEECAIVNKFEGISVESRCCNSQTIICEDWSHIIYL